MYDQTMAGEKMQIFMFKTFMFESANIQELYVVLVIKLKENIFLLLLWLQLRLRRKIPLELLLMTIWWTDETSWLPQRCVIYEHVIQEHLIYSFHKYI